uniref:Thioredoxin domain-containing protein 17 n=2 Tax=Hirondellea gigas TaxID=1518452 RepID=A0A2P2I025_9CRUS
MVQKHEVSGFEDFISKWESVKATKKTIVAMFSGGKDSSGKSWCPDCVVAQPVVDAAVDKASDDFIYIYCSVGGRDFWKNRNCIFRTDPRLRLKSVPTLLKLGSSERLEESQCADASLVRMLFED